MVPYQCDAICVGEHVGEPQEISLHVYCDGDEGVVLHAEQGVIQSALEETPCWAAACDVS